MPNFKKLGFRPHKHKIENFSRGRAPGPQVSCWTQVTTALGKSLDHQTKKQSAAPAGIRTSFFRTISLSSSWEASLSRFSNLLALFLSGNQNNLNFNGRALWRVWLVIRSITTKNSKARWWSWWLCGGADHDLPATLLLSCLLVRGPLWNVFFSLMMTIWLQRSLIRNLVSFKLFAFWRVSFCLLHSTLVSSIDELLPLPLGKLYCRPPLPDCWSF